MYKIYCIFPFKHEMDGLSICCLRRDTHKEISEYAIWLRKEKIYEEKISFAYYLH